MTSDKTKHLSLDVYKEDAALIDGIRDKLGSSRKEAIHVLGDEHRKKPAGLNQSQQISCVHLSNDGSLCGVHRPKFEKTSAIRCQLCQKEHQLFDPDPRFGIDTLELSQRLQNVINRQTMEIEQLKRPQQNLLLERDSLKARGSALENTLLIRDRRIVSLETDNGQLKREIEELSHDRLFEEVQLLKVQLAQKDNKNEDYKLEIEKLQALYETEQRKRSEQGNETIKMLRDLKQYLPTSLEAYDISTYKKNLQKRIEMFEGYLNTMNGEKIGQLSTGQI